MKNELTDRQQEILNFIHEFRDDNGYPPTLREIGRRFSISSTFGVKRHLDALVKKGYLNIESNASRGISIVKEDPSGFEEVRNDIYRKVPIVGRVAAGSPILAIENIEGSVIIDSAFMKKSQDSFALRVKGDSMVNAGIFENDLVIVTPRTDAANGDIVVAMLEDEVTVKTFEKKNNQVRLLPQNDNYQPIEVDKSKEFKLVGKVTGVVRWLN